MARRDTSGVLAGLGLLVVVGYVGAQLWAMSNTSYDIWGGLLVAPVLLLVSVPLLARLQRGERDPRIRQLVMVALVLKLAASLARFAVNELVYDGTADANAYASKGELLAQSYRLGIWESPTGKLPGTGFIDIVTGLVYAVTGPTRVGGFLVFSWFGFWGLYLFFRAFSLAVPGGDRLRYGVLVLLLPSLLFWPSSIGKEAWMMLTLGLAAYGAARLLSGARGGVPVLLVGALGAAMVRPHMALLITVALVAAYIVRPSRTGGLAGKGLALAGLALGGFLLLSQVQTFFGVESADGQGVEAVLDRTQEQTDQGDSAFGGSRVTTPLDLPGGILNVLFRPFPTEADSAQSLVASVEGLFLLIAFAASWRRLRELPRALLRTPYVTFAVTYSLLFVVAFSTFANFGILTRQRVQVFPFVLVLLALPYAGPSSPVRRVLRPRAGRTPDPEPLEQHR